MQYILFVFIFKSLCLIYLLFCMFWYYFLHILKDWSTLFLFASENERARITCKSCEGRSTSPSFTRDPCPFIPQYKLKKCTSILIFMLERQITSKKPNYKCKCSPHVTSGIHWKIFATVFICCIAGECNWGVNICKWKHNTNECVGGTFSILLNFVQNLICPFKFKKRLLLRYDIIH